MTDRYADAVDRVELSKSDLAIATLVGRYIERREHDQTPCVHDLLAAAGEHGDGALDELRTLMAFCEAMRASDERAR